MTRPRLWLATAATLLMSGAAALAQPKVDPDWPCIQRRVPTIGARAVWSGPDLEAAGPWTSDPAAAALAQRLASRRTALDEVDALLDAFLKDAGADKATRLTRVFAGVLELVNNERDRVLSGIARYARGQQRMAERIRDEADRISAVKDAPGTQTSQDLQELETRFTWDKRIFDERSQALTYVCEVPVLLEQRLGEIARRMEARL